MLTPIQTLQHISTIKQLMTLMVTSHRHITVILLASLLHIFHPIIIPTRPNLLPPTLIKHQYHFFTMPTAQAQLLTHTLTVNLNLYPSHIKILTPFNYLPKL